MEFNLTFSLLHQYLQKEICVFIIRFIITVAKTFGHPVIGGTVRAGVSCITDNISDRS